MGIMSRSDVLEDPQFRHPYIDVDEWREVPVAHHYIHGGFEGTQARFCFYYPKKAEYKGRFFQPVSPFVGDEKESQAQTGVENNISMAILHGAYLVEFNLGGIVNGGDDPTLMYRACAACAEYSRRLARDYYGEHRPYGYIYGGSAARDRIVHEAEIVRIIHNREKVSTIADTIDEGNAYGVDEAWKHALAKGQKIPVFALDSWPKGKEGHSFYSMGLTIRFETGALTGETFDAIPFPGNCVTVNPGMDQRDMEELLSKAAVGDAAVVHGELHAYGLR